MLLHLDLLVLVFSYCDHRTVSYQLARVSRKWRNAALFAVPPAVTRYFQRHWTQEPVELALPSNILAMSASTDESSIYIFAKGTVQEDDAVLYVHCRRSGQRYFAGLPAVFSQTNMSSSGIEFSGPNWLTLRLPDGAVHLFDCEKGIELTLPEGASDLIVSPCGRYVGLLYEDHIIVGQAGTERVDPRSQGGGSVFRQRSRQHSAEDDFGSSGPGGFLTKWGGALSHPSSPIASRTNPRRELHQVVVRQVELRVQRRQIGETSLDTSLYVHQRMLVTTLSRRESIVFSCFMPSAELEDPHGYRCYRTDEEKARRKADIEEAEEDAATMLVGAATALRHNSLKLQGVTLQVAQLQATDREATLVGIGVSVNVVLLFWNPVTNVLRETTLQSPALQPLRSRSRYEQLSEIVSGQVLSFTSWSDSPAGDFSLHFVSVDGSLMSTIPLKGPSMWLPLPKSGQAVACLKTGDTYGDDAPHPLLEATEYGMGTLLTFLTAGQVSEQAQRARAEGNRLLRRILCVTSVSVVLIGLSFVIAVGTLLYNGWWLHMQLLFTTSP